VCASFGRIAYHGQTLDLDEWGINFGYSEMCFWRTGVYALGQQTHGRTIVGFSFAQPAEGPYAFNNGERGGFVLTAFQVLLVRPVDGSCALMWSSSYLLACFGSPSRDDEASSPPFVVIGHLSFIILRQVFLAV
jgi:hypothetical protein